MRKSDARDWQPGWDRDFEIIARTGCAPSLGRDRADHRKSKRGMKCIYGDDEHGPSPAPLMSDGRVRVEPFPMLRVTPREQLAAITWRSQWAAGIRPGV